MWRHHAEVISLLILGGVQLLLDKQENIKKGKTGFQFKLEQVINCSSSDSSIKELNFKITFLDIEDVKKVMPGLIEVSPLWR